MVRATTQKQVGNRTDAPAGSPSSWAVFAVLEIWLAILCAPLTRAKFGIVDDHNVIDILDGHDERLPLTNIVGVLLAHVPEGNGRFRPGFWTALVLESTWAGRNPLLWYLDRFVLLSLTAAAIFWAVRLLVSSVAAGATSLLVLVGWQFEPWARLEAAEAYAVPLFAWGMALLVRGVRNRTGFVSSWPALVLLQAAALVKENFLPALVVCLVAAVIASGPRKFDRRAWSLAVAAGCAALVNGLLIAHSVRTDGYQYTSARSVQSAAAWAEFAAGRLSTAGGLVWSTSLAVLALLLSRQGRSRWTPLVVVSCVAMAMSQVAFYAGNAETGRYLLPLSFVVGAVWVWLQWHIARSRSAVPAGRIAGSMRVGSFVACGLSLVVASAVSLAFATNTQQTTTRFQSQLNALRSTIDDQDPTTLVIQPERPETDYELVLSLARYLKDTGVPASTLPATTLQSPLDRSLADDLKDWSSHGSEDGSLQPHVPPEDCLSVVFGNVQPVCSTVVHAPGDPRR